jgi:hypothetical protein
MNYIYGFRLLFLLLCVGMSDYACAMEKDDQQMVHVYFKINDSVSRDGQLYSKEVLEYSETMKELIRKASLTSQRDIFPDNVVTDKFAKEMVIAKRKGYQDVITESDFQYFFNRMELVHEGKFTELAERYEQYPISCLCAEFKIATTLKVPYLHKEVSQRIVQQINSNPHNSTEVSKFLNSELFGHIMSLTKINPVLTEKPRDDMTHYYFGNVRFIEKSHGYVTCSLMSGSSSTYLGTYAKSDIAEKIIISPNGDYVLKQFDMNEAVLYDRNNVPTFLPWKDDEWRQIEKKFFCKNNVLFVQTAKALKLINVQGEIVFERERKVTGRDVLFNVQQTRLVTQNKDKYIIIVDTETDYVKNIIFVTGDVWYGFNPRDENELIIIQNKSLIKYNVENDSIQTCSIDELTPIFHYNGIPYIPLFIDGCLFYRNTTGDTCFLDLQKTENDISCHNYFFKYPSIANSVHDDVYYVVDGNKLSACRFSKDTYEIPQLLFAVNSANEISSLGVKDFSADGMFILLQYEGGAKLVNARTGAIIEQWKIGSDEGNATSVAFDANGKEIVVTDAATGKTKIMVLDYEKAVSKLQPQRSWRSLLWTKWGLLGFGAGLIASLLVYYKSGIFNYAL